MYEAITAASTLCNPLVSECCLILSCNTGIHLSLKAETAGGDSSLLQSAGPSVHCTQVHTAYPLLSISGLHGQLYAKVLPVQP
jgi:hypothetical protein